MAIHTIRVREKIGPDVNGQNVLHDVVRHLQITSLRQIDVIRVYRLEGLTHDEAHRFATQALAEPTQTFTLDTPTPCDGCEKIEVAYKPGVMNPTAGSILKMAHDLGYHGITAADASQEYLFFGDATEREIATIVDRLLVNKTVSRVMTEEPTTLLITGEKGVTVQVEILNANDEALLALSKDKLFLTLDEMRIIRGHFQMLGRNPTNVELETLAQTWSEHCGHKTFNAIAVIDGMERPSLMQRLRQASSKRTDLTVSSFVDNSGVIHLYEGWALCGKVETHNSPSAIEPYGGAMTGSGGVFRDIMGTGEGAKTILSTDMFCLAPWDLPQTEIPSGCLHPGYLLSNVVRGVMDYGNRMGIPTSNGSLHFHQDFRAKPTVIVGAYGLIRIEQAQKGEPLPGDKIIAIGGRTGRDGIHGATFSSAEMTERTVQVNATAVQIGHAIEEKRTSDALLACRDRGYIRAVTDCGAGGFSSAIGEMGSKTGVHVRLETAPLKYTGLAPWEIWISESQERMILAVSAEHEADVLELCRFHNVEATVLGEFTNTARLLVTYDEETVCELDMTFLHHGLPQRRMIGAWERPSFDEPTIPEPTDWTALLKRVMGHPNICSREPIVRRYDHGVQGTNALPPYGGVRHNGPNDAVVLRPFPDKPWGCVVSHGLNPVVNRIDPYWGAMWALTEALANYVAVGGDPEEVALIDNFIWPVPTPHHFGGLNLAIDACVDFATAMNIDFVSGKDSLSSTYRDKNGGVIEIPPVLCISAMGRIPDVSKTVTADFKRPGESLILIDGIVEDKGALGGSIYHDLHGMVGSRLPRVLLPTDLKRALQRLHADIIKGSVLACHDISEGGLIVAIIEMCIGGNCGAEICVDLLTLNGDKPALRLDTIFFNETPGRFVIEKMEDALKPGLFPEWLLVIGKTLAEPVIRFINSEEPGVTLHTIPMDELTHAWQAPLKEIF